MKRKKTPASYDSMLEEENARLRKANAEMRILLLVHEVLRLYFSDGQQFLTEKKW
jgi:hypothetical protein